MVPKLEEGRRGVDVASLESVTRLSSKKYIENIEAVSFPTAKI